MNGCNHYVATILRYHGLYVSTSCCISQWPSQWGWANCDPPQLRNCLTDFDENGILDLSSEDHPPCKISFRSDDVGGLGEYPVCHCWVSFVVFSGLFVMRIGRTGGLILTIYTSYDVFSPKDVPFGVLLICLPIYGVKSSKNPNFGGVNRRSQPNC